MLRSVEVPGDQVRVLVDIGPGKVVSATLFIEDGVGGSGRDSGSSSDDEWEKVLDELLALSPVNPYPVDDSREAIYGPDPDEGGAA